MCKHILNATVAVRAPCCKKWFDCPQCHAETSDHPLRKTTELTLLCKKCRKAFRKDLAASDEMDESDEYCPNCDAHYVLEAKTPQQVVSIESEDVRVDNRIIVDDRARAQHRPTDLDAYADQLG